MSETHSETATQAYVRTEMLSEQPAPVSQTGAVKWIRENLFSSIGNSIMTILSVAFIAYVLIGIMPWMFGGVWNAGSLAECRTVLGAFGGDGHSGACWAVIEDRWRQLVFGFYPQEYYWRPVLTFVLLGVALAPILFSDWVPRQLMIFSVLFPFVAVWLIWGGSVWVPMLVVASFGVGYLVYRLAATVVFTGLAVGLAIVATFLWWAFAVGAIDSRINAAVGAPRYDSAVAELEARLAALPEEVATAEALVESIAAEEAEVIADRDATVSQIMEGASNVPELQDELLAYQRTLTDVRNRQSEAARALTVVNAELSDGQRLLDQYLTLPALLESLPELRENVANAQGDDVAAAEAALSGAQERIDSIYSVLGRVGLPPVQSREIGGFLLAFILGVSGIVLSFPLGILLALGRQSDLILLKMVSVGFIEVIRGVPLIVWLITASLLLNYFLPPGTTFDLVLRVVIMVTLFASAYMAEVIRGGLAALPRGQYEGADSLGLNYSQSMRLIVLPQALKISIPGIVSTFIGLFKDTVLVVFIGLLDPIGFSNSIRADTDWNGVYWEIFIFIGACFFVFCYGMSQYSQYLERKLATGHR
ncbi:amino acid ABC transporter permease [Gymnodinialimonas sp.]